MTEHHSDDKLHNDRLHELMESLVNDAITPAQHEELQVILRNNPEAQEAYLSFVDVHIGLQKLVGSEKKTVGLNGLGDNRSWSSHGDRNLVLRKNWTPVQRGLAAAASLATAVLLLVSLSSLIQRPNANHEVTGAEGSSSLDMSMAAPAKVQLSQAAAAEMFGAILPRVGGSFEYGREYALISGMMELRFPNGAEVILEAPSVIEIASPDRLIVTVGRCSVHTPLVRRDSR